MKNNLSLTKGFWSNSLTKSHYFVDKKWLSSTKIASVNKIIEAESNETQSPAQNRLWVSKVWKARCQITQISLTKSAKGTDSVDDSERMHEHGKKNLKRLLNLLQQSVDLLTLELRCMNIPTLPKSDEPRSIERIARELSGECGNSTLLFLKKIWRGERRKREHTTHHTLHTQRQQQQQQHKHATQGGGESTGGVACTLAHSLVDDTQRSYTSDRCSLQIQISLFSSLLSLHVSHSCTSLAHMQCDHLMKEETSCIYVQCRWRVQQPVDRRWGT